LKTILLIDTLWEGHHPTYMKHFAKTLLDLGHEVLAACPDPQGLKKWIHCHCLDASHRFTSIALDEPEQGRSLSRRLQARTETFARWLQAAKCRQDQTDRWGKAPDLTFFTWLDSYLGLTDSIVDHIFPYPWSGLFFQPRHALRPGKSAWLRRGVLDPLCVLRSSGCSMVAVQDEAVSALLEHRLGKPVVTFPDFTDESPPDSSYPLIPEILRKAGDRKIIGLLGSLERRKGLLTLLEVAQQSNRDWFFIFAGKLAESSFSQEELSRIRRAITLNPDNCIFHLTPIPTEAQFNGVVNACDVIYAAYENFQTSSNLLIKAAIFEKPVIAGEHYCVGERVRRFDLGYTLKEVSVRQCLLLLQKIREELCHKRLSIHPDFKGFREQHSIKQLSLSLEALLGLVGAT
jgi:glycosyltransferase involved in cell wall biosynthesis